MKTGIPRDRVPDSTIGVPIHGYEFIGRKCAKLGSDVIETRLLFERTICMYGEAAAEVFYDTSRFKRDGAAPGRVKKTLFGVGGVQGLDDDEHRQRKTMLMSLMAPARVQEIVATFARIMRTRAEEWERQDSIVLYAEMNEIICMAVCEWSGVPLPAEDVPRRTADIVGMIEGSGAVGPRHWRGRRARKRSETWAKQLILDTRAKRLHPRPETALHVIAHHRNDHGDLLDAHAAAVELLNILRPTVAVSRYITFSALALQEHPEWRSRLRSGDDDVRTQFVQEVRRFYPFFPLVAARVRDTFQWNGYTFPGGRLVLLDLYGTNRDERRWVDGESFRPERFAEWDESPFGFIPQGGGEFIGNHRCAGEWVTIELAKAAVAILTDELDYDVPPQDLSISLSRIPAIPRSRMIVQNVIRREPGAS